jgi:hypothetical protein
MSRTTLAAFVGLVLVAGTASEALTREKAATVGSNPRDQPHSMASVPSTVRRTGLSTLAMSTQANHCSARSNSSMLRSSLQAWPKCEA